ncbi:MAG: helix-turn-helix transcriptional regulator [Phycisphaeraceae bacterium]|nr:helix-turn-helix transcriptional regulator [Phycisphaeraceae bacterium]
MIDQLLRDARSKAGLTQQELADRAGVTREYVSMLERSRRQPTVDVLLRLCKALSTPASEIVAALEKDYTLEKVECGVGYKVKCKSRGRAKCGPKRGSKKPQSKMKP